MNDKCLIEFCNARAGNGLKGLCMRCYGQAKTKVLNGETTWEELADMGLANIEPRSPFNRAFQKLKETPHADGE